MYMVKKLHQNHKHVHVCVCYTMVILAIVYIVRTFVVPVCLESSIRLSKASLRVIEETENH